MLIIHSPPAPKPKTPKKKTTASPHKESPPPEPLEPETVDPDVPASTEEPLPPNPHPQSPPSVSYPHWISEPAELWIWKMPEGEYHPRGSVTAQIVQRPSDPRYVHHLAIFDSDGGESLIHPVSSDMSQRFSHTVLSFGWNHVNSETGLNESFLLRLVDEETLDRFVQQFSGALWETSFQLPWTKLKADEQEYILSSNADEDVVMADPETDEEEEEAIADELDPDNGMCSGLLAMCTADVLSQSPAKTRRKMRSWTRMACPHLSHRESVTPSSPSATRATAHTSSGEARLAYSATPTARRSSITLL